MILFYRHNPRVATLIRIGGLALVVWSVCAARRHPGLSGRALIITVTLAAATAGSVALSARLATDRGSALDVYVMAVAGGLLCGASPNSAASAFVFVAVVAGGSRFELPAAIPLALAGSLALAASMLLYDDSPLGLLAYVLGFAAALLAASNAHQTLARTEQAELLLAQSQRSHEEQLRAARLEESARIAREIHDVLAHALAGLTIQLEATTSLLERGADRDEVLARVRRAHELAREGLRETRRAVGALRGESVVSSDGIEALVADYRASADAPAQLTIDGDRARLGGPTGEAILRVVQEALTNVRKHAPGAEVSVAIHAGSAPGDDVVVVVEDRLGRVPTLAGELAVSGGGYGVQGMRERAELLGGTLTAGPADRGWRVALRLPAASRRESR